ncbi:hypothetical protein BDM02DRAFT_693367 [Thelephora ganbajun]|uniref:Uncharacterized protein n=1 Tax=Thelephora ganbajun TaxID=370292 RepID=A0ACB6Z5Z5_THEGA|nr:hypothetical protein BDM02DRAFT_693367 [Thelephora ganbajun]
MVDSLLKCSSLIIVQRSTFNHELGGQPWKNNTRELTKKFGPLNHTHKRFTPELIVRGSKDHRLPETDGIAAFHALQKRVPGHLVIFLNGDHWVLNRGNSLKWHYEVFRCSTSSLEKITQTRNVQTSATP